MMGREFIPVSGIVPTAYRSTVLQRTLESLFAQSHVPRELVVVDASGDDLTQRLVSRFASIDGCRVIYKVADKKGAAAQRTSGLLVATQPTIFFFDDDLIFEPECIIKIFHGFDHMQGVGAVNAMITNQRYMPPGMITRFMYRILSGENKETFAGRLIGPGWNLLPEDRAELPDYVQCDWLNTTCTMYRRSVLPDPLFDKFFTGYSLLEDVALSVRIKRTHILLNARTARIYHDSQPGSHKNSIYRLAQMEVVNRHYIMTRVLNKSGIRDYMKLFFFEAFQLASTFRSYEGIKSIPFAVAGRMTGILKIIRNSGV
jgi:glycosyltransferase involved in cell wall biosynthesis